MKNIKWAMIGCGAVTEKKSGPGLYKSKNSELLGVYDENISRAKDYAKRHNISKVYENVDEIMNDKNVDAVYLPVPPKYHKDYTILCLKNSKIPYVEKPLALTFEEGKEILDLSSKTKIPVYVAYYRRAMEKYLFIKEIIDSGKLGKISTIQLWQFMKVELEDKNKENLHWRLIPEITLGGKFVDMATHVIDITQFFFGDIVEVQGFASNNGGFYEVEDTVTATFKYKNGIVGTGNWNYVSSYDDEKMIITGDKGVLKTTGLFNGAVEMEISEERTVYSFEEPEHVAQPYIQEIVNEMLGIGKSNANIKSALNNLKVVDKILEDYRLKNYKFYKRK